MTNVQNQNPVSPRQPQANEQEDKSKQQRQDGHEKEQQGEKAVKSSGDSR